MAIRVEAVYEDGVLKPTEPLPLREHEKVRIVIDTSVARVQATAGWIGWKGDPEILRRVAEDDEFGILEPP